MFSVVTPMFPFCIIIGYFRFYFLFFVQMKTKKMPVPKELTFCLYEIEILSSLLHLQLIFVGIPCDTDGITSLCFARNNQFG